MVNGPGGSPDSTAISQPPAHLFPLPGVDRYVRLYTFNPETWRIACTLVQAHGRKAKVQAEKATEVCLAEKNLDGALECLWVVEAVTVLLEEQPKDGECIH
jgi:hypothetical protein